MNVSKISFRGVNSNNIFFVGKNEHATKDLHSKDKEMSRSAKYMIGAAALAGIVTVGIIGHKNNWWRKSISKAENSYARTSDINTPKILPDTNHMNETANIDKQEQEFIEKILKVEDLGAGNTVTHFEILNPETGNVIERILFKNKDKGTQSVLEYNLKTGKLIKQALYHYDGQGLKVVYDCDSKTGKLIRHTIYQDDGKKIKSVRKCNPETGCTINTTYYKADGVTIDKVAEAS